MSEERQIPFFILKESDTYEDYQKAMRAYRQGLVKKWKWLLVADEERGVPAISAHLWEPMALLFENQQAASQGVLEATRTTDVALPVRYALPIVRKVFPQLIATKIAAIQPMPLSSGGVAQIFYQDFEREGTGESVTVLDSDYALGSEDSVPKQIKMTITSDTVTAIKDILGAVWSTEVQEDARGALGLDVPGELVNQCAQEILRELDQRVLNEILNGAGAGNVNWDETVASGYIAKEWYETLYHAIVDADDLIYGNRYRETDWVVCGRNIYKYITKGSDWKPAPGRASREQRVRDVGTQFEGVYASHWDIYRTPVINANKAIVGVYPRSQTDTGYVFAPYIPIQLMPLIYASYDATQVVGNITISPGGRAEIPRAMAFSLLKAGIVDLELPLDADDMYLWRDEQGTITLLWLSPFSIGDGYATAAENMVDSLLQLGIQLAVRNCWFLVTHGLRPHVVELLKRPLDDLYRVGICMATPGEFHKLPTPYKIGITMYETTDPLIRHPEWRHHCNAVDRLILPSEWCREVFSKFAGVPIDVVPLAVHEGYLHAKQKEPKDTFTFISYATLSGRKSPLETLELFQKVFPKSTYPDVRIRFKTRSGHFGIGAANLPRLEDPRVEVVNATWLQSEMRQYLDDADCMLYLSKGEGFGMPPREAVAASVPTIVAHNTGLREFCDKHYMWPVPTDRWEESPLGGNWAIPDWDYAADVMKWVYKHRERAYAKAQKGAQWFAEMHGPLAAAEQLMLTLDRLSPQQAKPKPQSKVRTGLGAARSHKKVHEHFYKRLSERYPAPKQVFSIGNCGGSPHAVMANSGYDVYTLVTEPGDAFEMTRLNLAGLSVPGPVVAVHPYRLGRELGLGPRDVCVSVGVLEHFSPLEVPKIMTRLLEMADAALFSVPSVHYPRRDVGDEHLMRAEQWLDILSSFLVPRIEYYGGPSNNWYILGWVKRDDGSRGYVVKHHGRMREGVWRPLK